MPIVYAIFLLLAACFSFRYDRIETFNRQKSRCFRFLCGYLICLSGFRYGVGRDTLMYMRDFEEFPTGVSFPEFVRYSLQLKSHMPGWLLLNMLVRRIFGSFYVLQFIHAAFVNITFCHFASKYTKRVFLFLLLYFLWSFFFFNTEVMREAVAVSFCMFGMEFYMEGKRKLFVLFFLMGLMFHISAIAVLAFPIANFKPQWKFLFISVGISFIMWLFSDLFMGKIILTITGQADAFSRKIVDYSSMASDFKGFVSACASKLIFPFTVMYYALRWETSGDLKKKKKKLMSFAILLGICISSYDGSYRLWSYVQIFHLFFLADFAFWLFRHKELLVIRSFVMCGTLYFILNYQFTYLTSVGVWCFQSYVPYTSIFNEDSDVKQFREGVIKKRSTISEDENTLRDIPGDI